MSSRPILDRASYIALRREGRIRIESTLATYSICLVLFILPILFFWKLTLGGEVLYWGTPMLQFYPWRQLAVEMYQNGQVPLWDQYLGAGTPLAANLQSAVFYPVNAIFLIFPVENAMGYSLVAHVCLAGLFSYFLGRTLGFSRLGSVVTALTFMFSGFLISRAHFLSMTSVVAWLPLLLAATERIVKGVEGGDRLFGQKSCLNLFLLIFATGMTLLAGHAQLAYYGFWFVLLYSLYRVFFVLALATNNVKRSNKIRMALLACSRLALGVVLGIGLAAVQLALTLELAMNSVRANGAGYDFAMALSLYPWQLLGLVVPDLFGSPVDGTYWGPGAYFDGNGYIGILPFVLAVLAVASHRYFRKSTYGFLFYLESGIGGAKPEFICRLVPFLVLIVVVSLLFAIGGYSSIYPFVFNNIPGFNLFQAPDRFLYLYTFSMALLAGIGMTFLQLREYNFLLSRAGILVALGLGIALGMRALDVYAAQITALAPTFPEALRDFGLLLALTGVVLLAKRKFEPLVWSVFAVLFIIFDLFLANTGLDPSTDPGLYKTTPDPVSSIQQAKQDYRVLTPEKVSVDQFYANHSFKSFGDSDLASAVAIRNDFLLDTGVTYGILEANNYDPLQLGNAYDLKLAIDKIGPSPQLLNLFSARYVMDDSKSSLYNLPLIYDKGAQIWENTETLARSYIVHSSQTANSHAEALAQVLDGSFDPKEKVVLETKASELSGGLSAHSANSDEYARIVASDGNRVLVESSLDSPGYLVLTDSFYPGWKVLVDGLEKNILQADYAFRAVELGPGQHEVEFKYEPASFNVGLMISLGSLLATSLIGLLGLVQWLRGRRKHDSYLFGYISRN